LKRELTEIFDSPRVQILSEDAVGAAPGAPRFLHFIAEIQRADFRNRNGRVYPRPVLEREIKAFQKKIDEKIAFGEADHPKDGRPSVSRTSVLWEKVWMESDGRVKGQAKVLNTHVGRDVTAILEAGGQIGTSSRALGTTTTGLFEGQMAEVVNEDLEISAFDVVTDPSVVTAVPEKMFVEQTERKMDIKTLAEFRTAHPVLHESLVREAIEKAKTQMEPSVTRLLESKNAEFKTAHLAELTKAGTLLTEARRDEFARMRAFVDTTVAMLTEAGLIAKVPASDTELSEQVRTLREDVAKLTAENTALTEALDRATTLIENSAVKAHVVKLVEASDALRGHPFRAEITERALADLKKPEEAPKRLEEAVTYFDGLRARVTAPVAGSANGVGHAVIAPKTAEKAPLQEAAERAAGPSATKRELTKGEMALARMGGALAN